MPVSEEKPVYQRVYQVVRQIPPGKVTSYGRVAQMVEGCTARMVGYALAALRPDTDVPWHRVINAQGKISPRANGPGSLIQRQLLEEEGVVFDAQNRVDFEIFGWIA